MRTIAAVTVSRADYGIFVPLLKILRDRGDVALKVIAASAHLSRAHGSTIREIESDGFQVDEQVEMLLASDRREAIAASMGLGVIGFAKAYERLRPDIVVVLGDRFETHAAATAALPLNIPVAHIAGGEVTTGAIDDSLRHSITKLSHLHFVSTEEDSRRIRQMGEEPWRVFVTGTMSVDNAMALRSLSLDELSARFGIKLVQPFMIVTFHPVTLEHTETATHISELLAAVEASGLSVLFTMPNADAGAQIVRVAIDKYVACHRNSQRIESLGTLGYFSTMSHASVMLGNSSSGIIEAASFGLPVVNVGGRQQGRPRSKNVIDTGNSRAEITTAIGRAVSGEFRRSLADMVNPYGDGHGAERISDVLCKIELGRGLLLKRFVDMPAGDVPGTANRQEVVCARS